jgi:hypothetical protein
MNILFKKSLIVFDSQIILPEKINKKYLLLELNNICGLGAYYDYKKIKSCVEKQIEELKNIHDHARSQNKSSNMHIFDGIHLFINSHGGNFTEGAMIYNYLLHLKKKYDLQIDCFVQCAIGPAFLIMQTADVIHANTLCHIGNGKNLIKDNTEENIESYFTFIQELYSQKGIIINADLEFELRCSLILTPLKREYLEGKIIKSIGSYEVLLDEYESDNIYLVKVNLANED